MEQQMRVMTTLEDLLVREFRACQSLLNLTKGEWHAFAHNDIPGLAGLVEEKEALLDELGKLEDERRMIVQQLAKNLHIQSAAPTVQDVALAIGVEEARQINNLRDGILALSENICELTRANHALAQAGIERIDALQSYLLDLYRPAIYGRSGQQPRTEQAGLILDIDQRF
jgi:flagellar biosynthesis/type III secretory pathway chaperone